MSAHFILFVIVFGAPQLVFWACAIRRERTRTLGVLPPRVYARGLPRVVGGTRAGRMRHTYG